MNNFIGLNSNEIAKVIGGCYCFCETDFSHYPTHLVERYSFVGKFSTVKVCELVCETLKHKMYRCGAGNELLEPNFSSKK